MLVIFIFDFSNMAVICFLLNAFFNVVITVCEFFLETLFISLSALMGSGMFWITVNEKIWLNVLFRRGSVSESAWIRLVVVFCFVLFFAFFSSLFERSRPIVCCCSLFSRSPVPHPLSSMMSVLFRVIFWSVLLYLLFCSSVYRMS